MTERRRQARGRPPTERGRPAESIAARLDVPFTAAGVLFVVVEPAEGVTLPAYGEALHPAALGAVSGERGGRQAP